MIDTSAIRNKLIYLAISGELVEQNADEGNANELIEKLSYEVNNASPCLNIDIGEIPYEIPTNWAWCRLSDIGSTNIGLTYHPEDVDTEGVPVLRANNIQNNRMIFDDLIWVTCEIREKQFINKNDILICARNGSKHLVGKCAIYNGELGETSFGAFMAVYRTPCFEYVYYYFQTKVFRRYFENENNKQINQVTQTILKDAIIPLPPLEEQKRIVGKLRETFELLDMIDKLQKSYLTDIKMLKSKLIDAGIQGKLTEQLPTDGTAEELYNVIQAEKIKLIESGILKGRKNKKVNNVADTDGLFEIPNNWKWIRLGEVCEVFGRIGFRGYTKADIVEAHEGAITISPSNIDGSGNIHFEECTYLSWFKYEESPEIQIDNEDIIIVKTGSSYGKAGIVKNLPEKATINPQLAVLKYVYCNKDYLNCVLNCSSSKKQYEQFVIGAAIPTFSQEKLANLLIPLPPLSEQKRIVDKIEEVLAII